MERRTIGVHDKLPILETLPLSFQHLAAMFGATILVSILIGVNPAIALLMNGIGTLIYSWVTTGYTLALFMKMVDIQLITDAAWFQLPEFHKPVYNPNAIIIIIPATLVVLAEHISHLIVTSKVTGEDLMKSPGLHRSLLGDGISNVISKFVGSLPNTTYGENIGVMAITRVYSVWVIRGAAILAIVFSCFGKIAAAISSIPTAVMGGITILLYGVIAVQGLRILIEQKVDFSKNSNMVLGAITFVIGISGAGLKIGTVELKGMAFSAIVGIILSLLFWGLRKIKILDENI